MTARGPASHDAAGGERQPRPLRADAERNRAAILAAAREVFAEQGLEAPLEEIALRAGVGIATLYRRFPDREHMVAAALVDKVTQYVEAAEQALAVPDPWAGFVSLVERICEMQADDRGLSDLLSMALPADEHVEQLRSRANGQVIELVERAKAAGQLREDFVGEDLLLLLIANAGVVHVTRADAAGAWRRFVALMLDAFRRRDPPPADPAGPLPAPPLPAPPLPAPPSTAQMTQAMLRLARERGCG
jgi:AcrR family transcriptional regulator